MAYSEMHVLIVRVISDALTFQADLKLTTSGA